MKLDTESGYALIFLFEIVATIGGSIWEDRRRYREHDDLRKAFVAAGVPNDRIVQNNVHDVIFNRGGNCNALKPDLHQPCERAKEALHVRYNPNGTVQNWQHP